MRPSLGLVVMVVVASCLAAEVQSRAIPPQAAAAALGELGERGERALPPDDGGPESASLEARVTNLRSTSVTQTTVRLQWRLEQGSQSKVTDYRIFYRHGNFTDSKTITSEDHESGTQAYPLTQLSPFTVYYIKVKGVLQGITIQIRHAKQSGSFLDTYAVEGVSRIAA